MTITNSLGSLSALVLRSGATSRIHAAVGGSGGGRTTASNPTIG